MKKRFSVPILSGIRENEPVRFSASAKYIFVAAGNNLLVLDALSGQELVRRDQFRETRFIFPGKEDRFAICMTDDYYLMPIDMAAERGKSLPISYYRPWLFRQKREPLRSTLPPRDPYTCEKYDLYQNAPDEFLRPRWVVSQIKETEHMLEEENAFHAKMEEAALCMEEKRYGAAYTAVQEARMVGSRRFDPECLNILAAIAAKCDKKRLTAQSYLETREGGKKGAGSLFGASGNQSEENVKADMTGLKGADGRYTVQWEYPEEVRALPRKELSRLLLGITADLWSGLAGILLRGMGSSHAYGRPAAERRRLLVFSTFTGRLLGDYSLSAYGSEFTVLEKGWIFSDRNQLLRVRDIYEADGRLVRSPGIKVPSGSCIFTDHMTRMEVTDPQTNMTAVYFLEWEYRFS